MLALSTSQGFYTVEMKEISKCFETIQYLNLKHEKRNKIATTFN